MFEMPGKRALRNPASATCSLLTLVLAASAGFSVARMASAEAPASPRALVPLLSSSQTIVGETLNYPSGAPARITAAILTLPPGAETGWHTHGVPTFGYMLDGELTVDYGEKGKRIYRAGDALLEAIQVAHNGRNTGSGPMRILAVFMGAEGLSNSVPVGR
jgi:quercetin dioxygenase-like cupin family protein